MNVAGSLYFVKNDTPESAWATRGSYGFLEVTEDNMPRWKRALGSPVRFEVEWQDHKVSDGEICREIVI